MIPNWLITTTWLAIIPVSLCLWFAIGWLIALAAQWIGTIGMWVLS